MNLFVLSGNLTADPTFTQGQEESKNRANFSIAYNHSKEKATFFRCTTWGKNAERICKLAKGKRVLVTGEMEENEWTDQNGQKRQDKQIIVRNIDYIDFPDQQAAAPQQQQQPQYQQPQYQPPQGYAPPPQGYPPAPQPQGYAQHPQYQQPPQPQQGYGAPPPQYPPQQAQPQYPPQPAQQYPPQQQPPFPSGNNPPF